MRTFGIRIRKSLEIASVWMIHNVDFAVRPRRSGIKGTLLSVRRPGGFLTAQAASMREPLDMRAVSIHHVDFAEVLEGDPHPIRRPRRTTTLFALGARENLRMGSTCIHNCDRTPRSCKRDLPSIRRPGRH